MTSHWFSIVTLLAALIIGYGIFESRNDDDTETIVDRPVVLGYYLKNAIITETSESGVPRLRFAADDVTQNPDDNSVALTSVRIDYLWASKEKSVSVKNHVNDHADQANEPNHHWVLNANHAEVPAKSQQIALTGDVEAHSVGAAHDTTLNTQLLNLDTNKEIAQSPELVNVTVDGHALTGRGLFVDLKKQHVQLHSDVQVRIAATSSRSTANTPASTQDVSLPGVFYSESSDYKDNVLILNKVRSKVEPLIEADQARASGTDLANNQIVLRGAVHLELPQKGQLNADVATVTVQESRIGQVHVTGVPVKFEHKAQNSQKIAHGHAKTIDYNVAAQTLHFSGDAWFTDGDIQLNADKIDYDINTGHAHSDRSTITINPRTINDALPKP